MKNLIFILFLIFISCNSKNESVKENASSKWMHLEGNAQGTTFSIKYEGEIDYSGAVKSIFDEMDAELSLYIDSSLISKFNNDSSLLRMIPESSKHFSNVYFHAQFIFNATNGAFNPIIYPLVEYWGFGRKAETPDKIDSAEVERLRAFIDMSKISFDRNLTKINCLKGTKFDFNGIAQGYTVDVIAAMLENYGIKNYMIEVGGEVRAKGKNEREQYWKLGIDKPIDINAEHELQAIITLVNRSMATSGNYRKFYEKDGVRYSHTIDPATGYPVQHSLLSATVLADDCASADAYATAFMVMGVEKTKEFLKKNPKLKLDVYLIYSDVKGEFKTWFSKGINANIDEKI